MSAPNSLNFINTPGVKEIQILHQKGVDEFPDVTHGTNLIETAPTLNAGYAWTTDFYFTPYTANYTESEELDRGTNTWSVKVECFQPKNDEDDIYAAIQLERKRFIIDCTDNDGRRRLVGTKDQPLRLAQRYQLGIKPGEPKGTVFVFEGRLSKRPPFYSS
jgi:hypothetical protein